MKGSPKITKAEIEKLDFSEYDKGVSELAESGIIIDLDTKRKELLEAFEERSMKEKTRINVLESLKQIEEQRKKINLTMKEYLKNKTTAQEEPITLQ